MSTRESASTAVIATARRDQVVIAISIALVLTLAWAYLIRLQHQMNASAAAMGMGMAMDAPWSATEFAFTFAMWTVMMVGMMTPAIAPLLLLFATTSVRRAQRGASTAVGMFGLGYLAVWAGFSACAALAQWGLHNAALLSPAMAATSSRLGAALLVAAGIYQLTPAKRTCLDHCQSPLGFLMSHWRDGSVGAFRMGLHHGIFCLGCCWALMGVLFVVGVMNLVWVGALTIFILLERVGPSGVWISRVGAVSMAVLGILRLTHPN